MKLEVVKQLVELRQKHPTWGPRKLIAYLAERDGQLELPATSTVQRILADHMLVRSRKRRRYVPPHTQPLEPCDGPNDIWTADFKGHFALGNGETCHPFTLCDAFSRYLLRVQALRHTNVGGVRAELERAFAEFGLPKRFRSDNGSPFASSAAGGLTPLSVWLIRLGIAVERIEPGHPEQNGRHERMHLTLEEAITPARATQAAQQRAFKEFRRIYNHERPHEALGQKPPGAVYRASEERMPKKLPEIDYPAEYRVARVRDTGCVKWGGTLIRVAPSLARQRIGLRAVSDGCWEVYFGPVKLGRIHDALPKLGLIQPSN